MTRRLSETLVRILRIQPKYKGVDVIVFLEKSTGPKYPSHHFYVVWPKAPNYPILRNSGNWPSNSDIPPQLTSFYQRETDQKGPIFEAIPLIPGLHLSYRIPSESRPLGPPTL